MLNALQGRLISEVDLYMWLSWIGWDHSAINCLHSAHSKPTAPCAFDHFFWIEQCPRHTSDSNRPRIRLTQIFTGDKAGIRVILTSPSAWCCLRGYIKRCAAHKSSHANSSLISFFPLKFWSDSSFSLPAPENWLISVIQPRWYTHWFSQHPTRQPAPMHRLRKLKAS